MVNAADQCIYHWHGASEREPGEQMYRDSIKLTMRTAPDGLYYVELSNIDRTFGIDEPIVRRPEEWRAMVAADGNGYQQTGPQRDVKFRCTHNAVEASVDWDGDLKFKARFRKEDFVALLDFLDQQRNP